MKIRAVRPEVEISGFRRYEDAEEPSEARPRTSQGKEG